MNEIEITCPHCSYRKAVAAELIPVGGTTIHCPQCHSSFTRDGRLGGEIPPDAATAAAAPPTTKFCPSCGAKIRSRAELCPLCGVICAPPASGLSKIVLLLVTFFLGGMGGHKFYQKKYLLGTLYLLFFWTFIPRLVSIVEFILYALKSESDLQQDYPEVNGGAILWVAAALVGIALLGILAAIAIPQFALYRARSHDALARSDLQACRGEVENYFAAKNVYPTTAGEVQCRASRNVALYYLSLGPTDYRLVSFYDQAEQAFILDSGDDEVTEAEREKTEGEIREEFAPAVLTPSFHFIE